jgi:hypothetical protein
MCRSHLVATSLTFAHPRRYAVRNKQQNINFATSINPLKLKHLKNLKIQPVPQREHLTSPLLRSTG